MMGDVSVRLLGKRETEITPPSSTDKNVRFPAWTLRVPRDATQAINGVERLIDGARFCRRVSGLRAGLTVEINQGAKAVRFAAIACDHDGARPGCPARTRRACRRRRTRPEAERSRRGAQCCSHCPGFVGGETGTSPLLPRRVQSKRYLGGTPATPRGPATREGAPVAWKDWTRRPAAVCCPGSWQPIPLKCVPVPCPVV